ncbi:MAG: hypothetical protein ACK4M8_02140 [Allorhizobium sp.]
MTLSLVEEIEQLANCRTHQECAHWLLTCPLSKLMTYEGTIRARLRTRGFLVGIEHLDHQLAMLRAPRVGGYMEPPQNAAGVTEVWSMIVDIARGQLVHESEKVPPLIEDRSFPAIDAGDVDA